MKRLRLTLLFSLMLLCGINLNSQEWEFFMDTYADSPYYRKFTDAIELHDGSIVVNSPFVLPIEDHSGLPHPGLVKLSADGDELVRSSYFRPAYCSISYNQILVNEDGELFALMTYSPDHERLSDNYFKNFDNPPANAILGLYKLDDKLNIIESYEHFIPIDTTERMVGYDPILDKMPNLNHGCLYLFTSFVDNSGDIVGSFFKCPTFHSPYQTENDTLFFFKMNFEGEILNMKGVECLGGNGDFYRHRGHSMLETDSLYILYQVLGHNYDFSFRPSGEALYFDKNLNFIDRKAINQPGYTMPHFSSLDYLSVVRSRHNNVYLTSVSRSVDFPNSVEHNDTRLYEINDNLDNPTDLLPIEKYIIRGVNNSKDHQPFNNGILLKEDNTLIYAQNWNLGNYENSDSWVVIEHLDENFETISELYYTSGEDGKYTEVNSIILTKEEDLLLVGNGNDIDGDKSWNFVTKFPASTFLSIEEAHAHGLKAAVAYPNPGGDVMNIRTGLRNAVLSVYDINGRKIHEQEITDDVTSVDASNWQSGTYIWKLGIRNEELGMKEVESGKWVK